MIPEFARTITERRQERGLSQKALAGLVRKEGGEPISTTYLNDIEHGRRRPSERVIEELARALELELDYLLHLLGILPADIRGAEATKQQVLDAYDVFRQKLYE